ncbi:DUF4232 domain-containing protein [Streptomyces sasae]|uniref:DUF4232 domain-containing protein n=1 Tax=Streptomyces sasae TaxID=1266772 RepID=UPI002931B6B6|nr:DUF4232 domain-containing protein [Streptomyces sasae]
MRTARRVRLLAATGAAVAALALSACQNGTGTKDEGTSGSANSTSASSTPKASEDSTGATSSGTSGSSGSSGTNASGTGSTGSGTGRSASAPAGNSAAKKPGSGGGSGTTARVLCNGSNTKVTAQPVSRPLNHMLLTVTNTGSKLCDLTYYPVVRFDEMQWVPQPDEDTHPQAVVSLAPGESGYAGVLLSAADGSGDGGTTGHRLTIAFQGRTPNSSGGASATPSLPTKGMYYDSSLRVTYWQQSRDDINGW